MKKTLKLTALLFLSWAALGAQVANELPGLEAKTPVIMGLGGSFVSVSRGFDAFFSNPAGFADSTGQFSLVATPWVYIAPTTSQIDSYLAAYDGLMAGGFNETIGLVNDIITGNGFGLGAVSGVAWTGQNLGLGLYALADSFLVGNNLLGAAGTIDMDVAMVLGVAFPVELGPVSLKIGGDIRPSIRARGSLDSRTLGPIIEALSSGGDLFAAFSGVPVDSGFSLAFDLGAILKVGRLSAGLSVRDLSLPLGFITTDLSTFLDTLMKGDMPGTDAGVTANVWTLPVIALGASFDLGFDKMDPWLDPIVHIELEDPLRVILDKQSPWNLLHVGAEAKLFRFMTLRAGINKGYLGMGLGMRLLILDINAAVFTEELGIRPGDRPRSGVSLEVALRGDFKPKRKAGK